MRDFDTDHVTQTEPDTAVRRFERVSTRGSLEVLTAELRLAEEVFDLSEGGVGVWSYAPLPIDTVLPARLLLPHVGEPVEVIIRVAWSEPDAMGLEFLAPDAAVAEAVDRVRLAQRGF